MPAQGRGAFLVPRSKPTPPPAQKVSPKPNIGPWKGTHGPKPQSKAPPKSSVFTQSLQKATQQNLKTGGYLQAYRETPAGEKAAAQVEHQRLQKAASSFNKLFGNVPSQKALESEERSIKAGVVGPNLLAAALGQGGVGRKIEDIGQALLKNPSGTIGHTIGSIPPAANALLTGTGRIVAETATGHPKALLDIPKGLLKEAQEEYGPKNRAQEIAKIEQHGALNPLLDATIVGGSAAHLLGRGVSSVIRASGRGADAFAKTQAYRDALNAALKSPATVDHVRAQQEARLGEYRAGGVSGSAPSAANVESALAKHKPSDLPPKPTAYEKRLAAKYESTQPRPNLRTSPGVEKPSIKPGAAVTTQTRSPNYFRARVQTAIDDARRRLQTAHLEKVAQVRHEAANNPHIAGSALSKPYAAQLAYDTARGEVMPLMQRAGPVSKFLGAARAQRIGASRIIGGEQTLQGRLSHGYNRESEKALRGLNTPQRKLLVFAKEGHIPLDDPQRATRWLQEVHDQAVEGSAGLRLGIQNIAKGSDVARETGAVLNHIKKNGPESVFTPKFQRAVQHVPDERRVSGRNPVLAANPDRAIARRYLPQIHMLAEWARRHPEHHDAAATAQGVTQIHQLNERGFDLRQAATGRGKLPHEPEGQRVIRAEAALERAKAGLRRTNSGPPNRAGVVAAERTLKNAKAEFVTSQKGLTALKKNKEELHARADEKLTTAKNLADEIARMHGLPTDHAYIPHVLTLQDAKGTGVGGYSPADYKRWEGQLQAHGTRSTDHTLIMRGLEKSLYDEHTMRTINDLEKRFAVQLPRKNMTQREVDKWFADTGRNPKDFVKIHFGKLRQDIQEGASADNLAHLNLDPTDRGRMLEHLVRQAAEAPGVRGTSLIPKAAFHEIQQQLKQSAAPYRGFGKLKGTVSKLMLGLSLPWATTMHLTYAIQLMMGGGGPIDFAAHMKYYKGLGTEDRARFDHFMGVDSPYHVSTHGIESEKVGIPNSVQGLAEQLRVVRNSPTGRFLAKGNPVDALLRFERNPRRLSRVSLAMKGVKRQAIREMGADLHGIQKGMNAFHDGLLRLQHVGRMPADEYMQKAFANTKAMEQVAEHAVHVMGEWHNSTAFEKNVLNRMIMFYPWMRYSLKLMAHTLPTRHPLIQAMVLKLGELEHHELVELLGTEPELGAVYLGPAQPNVPPEKRKFEQFGIKQANPVLNTVMETFGKEGNASQILSALPPYIASAIGYAVGKGLFTDKPLTGAKLGESQQVKGRPGILGYTLHELEQLFMPTRVAGHQLTSNRPQASESAPVAGLLGIGPGTKYREYGKKYEKKIAKEAHSKALLPELFPFLPHKAERLPQTIEHTKKEEKAERKLAKKQAKRDKRDAWPGESSAPSAPSTHDAWPGG